MKHLSKKTITAATSIASLFALNNADAAIISVTGQGFTADGSSISYWDVDGDLTADFKIQPFGAVSQDIYGSVSANGLMRVANTSTVGPASVFGNLSFGAIVGSAGVFADALSFVNTASGPNAVLGFTDGVQGYIGFRFDAGNGIGTTYGWAEATLSSGGTRGLLTIGDWAYTDDGSSIAVGAIPEPSSYALGLGALALGAAGVRRWRKAKADVA
jgi:hypothetical protein